MTKFILLIAAYLIGAIPWGWLLGKMKGIDIREHGSKNIGATNTGRVLGKKYAIIAYVLDTIKGSLPVWFAITLREDYALFSPIIYGIAASVGHTFPVYLGFKGGKAVATSGGAVLAYTPLLFVLLVALFFIVTYITRYVSAGSLAAAVTAVISIFLVTIFQPQWLIIHDPEIYDYSFPIGALIIVILIIVRHKSNIQRIVHKEEATVKWRK